MKITGTHINYYFHCKRHLWFFMHHIFMEQTSETVAVGKFISESTYERERHELHFEEEEYEYVLDFFDKQTNTIHEIKKTDKMEELHFWQVKFYIMRLKNLGFENVTGIINYPKLKKIVKVTLSDDDEKKLLIAIEEIKTLKLKDNPPPVIRKPFCRKCSYFELCYV